MSRPTACLGATAAFLIGCLGASASSPTLQDVKDVAARVERLSGKKGTTNEEVFGEAALLLPVERQGACDRRAAVAPARAEGSLKLSLMPLDLLLSQLALQTGANYHLTLREAQLSSKPNVLVLDKGTVTLSALKQMLKDGKFETLFTPTRDGLTAHVPLVVWSGAMLELQPGDRLSLDRAAGAFFISAGRFVSNGATIESVGDRNRRQPSFRPFALIALSGSAEVSRTEFRDLGMREQKLMTGLAFVEGGLYPARAASYVRDSWFERTGSLAFFGSTGTTISGNRFIASEGPAIVVDGGKKVLIARNVVAAAIRGHGIRITSGAEDIAVQDNVFAGNGLHGIFADRGTGNLTIRRNVITGNNGAAIRLVQTACTEISGNAVVANAQKGISIKRSIGVDILANLVAVNRSDGLEVVDQPSFNKTTVSDNTFIANKAGVYGVSYSELRFSRNDFRHQTPRLFSGELGQYTGQMLSATAHTGGLVSLTSATAPSQTTAAGFSPFNLQSCLGKRSN